MITGKTTDTTGKIENDTGKITGKTIDVTGKINQDAGKIQFSDDFSGEVAGKIPEIQEESPKYRGQRGQDKKPRNFPLHTLKNLPQFRDKSHEEIRRYILETRGVDIGGNFNWNGLAIAIFITIAVVLGGYGLWKWHNRRKYQND
ncbi:hypothetical protein K0U27_02075 [archaeon]|nr:hypothetical protein [archaeon]